MVTVKVAPGATKTTTNVVGLSWRPRLAKGLRLKGEYRHGSVDNPLMNVDAACSTLFSPRGLASPFLPEAAQYYEFQNARVADSTASPASWDDVRLRASYTKSQTSFSATYRWWDGTNTSGDLTDWSRTKQSATASIWRMPSPRYDFYAAYSWQQQSLGSPTCIPLYDG